MEVDFGFKNVRLFFRFFVAAVGVGFRVNGKIAVNRLTRNPQNLCSRRLVVIRSAQYFLNV